jgi:AcrR family transcriptional regulator
VSDADRLRELNLPDLWDLSRSRGTLYQKVVSTGVPAASEAPAKTEATPRERLLEAAGTLFARHGFPNVTLEQIQQAARISSASMFHLCVSKEDAFHQVLVAQVDAFVAESARWVDPSLPATELLRIVAERSFEYLPKRPLMLQLLIGLWVEIMPAWGDRFSLLRERCTTGFAKALEAGIAQKRFRPEINVEMVAHLLMDLHAASYLFADSSSPARVLQRRNAALDLILNGLSVE